MAAVLLDSGCNTATWRFEGGAGVGLGQAAFAALTKGNLKSFLTREYASETEMIAAGAEQGFYITCVSTYDAEGNFSTSAYGALGFNYPAQKPAIAFPIPVDHPIILKATIGYSVIV